MKLPRLGSACGILFPIVLFIAAGDGSQPFSAVRAVAATAALTLAIPFLAYLAETLRAAEGPRGWLGGAALAAGVTGIALKLGSGAPELALHNVGTPDDAVHDTLSQLGDTATVLSLFPLAVFAMVTAVVALRTRVLPLWLATFAAVAATALLVNGAAIGTDSVPGLLVFLAWALVTSVYLTIRPAHLTAPAPAPATATV